MGCIPWLQLLLLFYPRSPCGERPWQRGSRVTYVEFSIHALLAESDHSRRSRKQRHSIFYPRSPCGERHPKYPKEYR